MPTIARIYSGEVSEVQMRTAKKIAGALGYALEVDSGKLSADRTKRGRPRGKLTAGQKEMILKAVTRAVREELERV